MKSSSTKILIAGVGGQGIVYLTNIIVEAAILSNIPVSVSEIHGLSQRGGVVTSGIGIGNHCSGFVGKGAVDILFGLEPLETLRCLPYLNERSSAIFGSYQITPYSVNAQMASYPDTNSMIDYLSKNISETIYIKEFPKNVEAVLYNVFMLGRATKLKQFPFSKTIVERAIKNTVSDHHRDRTLATYLKGIKYE